MQCLPLNDYIVLGRGIIALNDVKLSTSYISPGPEYGYMIDEHYNDNSVAALLSDFQAKFPEQDISLTTKGLLFNQYKELNAFGEALPVLNCDKTNFR